MIIPFGEFLPDRATLANPGTPDVLNVIATASGYAPFQEIVTTTNALDARPRGAITTTDSSGNVEQYAGDAAKLYERVSDTWTDRSKVGGYSTAADENWEFLQWKNKVLATNFSDSPQEMALGGTVFSDLTTAFEGRHIAGVRDFVVFGNTNDSTDGEVRNRVRWSALGDETDYTVSQTTLSDFQDIPTGGQVQRVVGGEFGVVLLENSIWRMTFVGAPLVFQFDEVLPGIGAIAPRSVVRDGDFVYFLSDRGFFVIQNGSQSRAIGDTKVDRFVLSDIDQTSLNRMTAVLDTGSRRVYWAYPGAGATGSRPNKMVVYDPTLDRWSYIEEEIELMYKAAGVGKTLEDLDSISASLDALGSSLDSKEFQGGVKALGVFDENFKSGTFSGSNKTATLKTKEVEISEGRKTRLKAFRPLVDGGTVTGKIGERDRQSDGISFGSSLTQSSSGRFTKRSNARYHQFELTITGDTWTDALGVQVMKREARPGEHRG